MCKHLTNERGLTLVEVMGVLVLTVMILGALVYMLQYASNSLNNSMERERSIQMSHDILNHVVMTVRNGFKPEAYPEKAHSLKLVGENNQYVEYSFDQITHTLTIYYQLFDDKGKLTPNPANMVFHQVNTIEFQPTDRKITVEVNVSLPNNKEHTVSTIVYYPQL